MSRGASAYPADAAADTVHVGAFVDERLVAVATVCREGLPKFSGEAYILMRRPLP